MALIRKDIGRTLMAIKPQRLVVITKQRLPGGQQCSTTASDGDKNHQKPDRTKQTEQRRQAARIKLDQLLSSIKKTTPPGEAVGGVSDRLARPGGRPVPRNVVRQPRPAQHMSQPTQTGTQTDAQVEQTSRAAPTSQADAQAKKKTTERAKKSKKSAPLHALDEEVARAAREVASSLPGDPAQTERDLLSKLNGDATRGAQPGQDATPQLSELISGMRVTAVGEPSGGRADSVRSQLGEHRARDIAQVRRGRATGREASLLSVRQDSVDLNSGPALDIFSPPQDAPATAEVSVVDGVWERVHRREMQLSVTHPPANAWEQMIFWTEQGKLWTLPVDNEAGLEHETSVGFHEHVFLEGQLEPWCPPHGPLRHFMELVCVALGKNPWLSVAEKHEHIAWFRDYFAAKRELLQQLSAL